MYSCNVLKYFLSANLYVAVVSGLGIITQLNKFALFEKQISGVTLFINLTY